MINELRKFQKTLNEYSKKMLHRQSTIEFIIEIEQFNNMVDKEIERKVLRDKAIIILLSDGKKILDKLRYLKKKDNEDFITKYIIPTICAFIGIGFIVISSTNDILHDIPRLIISCLFFISLFYIYYEPNKIIITSFIFISLIFVAMLVEAIGKGDIDLIKINIIPGVISGIIGFSIGFIIKFIYEAKLKKE